MCAATPAPARASALRGFIVSTCRNDAAAFSPSPRWIASHPACAGSCARTWGAPASSRRRRHTCIAFAGWQKRCPRIVLEIARSATSAVTESSPSRSARNGSPPVLSLKSLPLRSGPTLMEGPLEALQMLARIAVACVLAAVPLVAVPGTIGGQQEEHPKVPKDSILVNVTGCLRGNVVRAEDVRQPDTTSGITVRNRSFSLAGKKDVKTAIKEADGQRVEISGLIKKSALMEPGMKFKGGRVVVGGGTSSTPTSSLPDPSDNVPVMDVLTVQQLGGSCG